MEQLNFKDYILILITYIIVFAVGVGNFGTGIRHGQSLYLCLFYWRTIYCRF